MRLFFLTAIFLSTATADNILTDDLGFRPGLPLQPVQPVAWPDTFHMKLDRSGFLAGKQSMEIWYDWPGDRQVEIFDKNGKVNFAIHNANGSLYSYSPGVPGCKVVQFTVGLLRPDWMQNGKYRGRQTVNNKICDVWAISPLLPPFPKPFLTYYDDATTGAMVREVFFIGVTDDVVQLTANITGSDELFQAPADCFKKTAEVLTDVDYMALRSDSTTWSRLDGVIWHRLHGAPLASTPEYV